MGIWEGQSIIPRWKMAWASASMLLTSWDGLQDIFSRLKIYLPVPTQTTPGAKWHLMMPSKGIILILGSREEIEQPSLLQRLPAALRCLSTKETSTPCLILPDIKSNAGNASHIALSLSPASSPIPILSPSGFLLGGAPDLLCINHYMSCWVVFRWPSCSSDSAFWKQGYCHIDLFNTRTQPSAWHMRNLIFNEQMNEFDLSSMQQASKYDLIKLHTASHILPYAVRAVCNA